MQAHANAVKDFVLLMPARRLAAVLDQEWNALRDIRAKLMLCKKFKIPEQPKIRN